jgi:hypothetical protein
MIDGACFEFFSNKILIKFATQYLLNEKSEWYFIPDFS